MDKQLNVLKPYSIFTPPFEVTSGGVRVMYGLYGWLLAKGQIVYLNSQFNHSDCVGIYPEIQYGNPAEAFTVVRYILNEAGVVPAIYSDGTVKEGPVKFNDTDILYYFSRLFGETDEKHYMFLPILNMHLFKDQKKRRKKCCNYFGKGIKERGVKSGKITIHPENALSITREIAQDQQALADFLNECEVMYCYDPISAMHEIARLCGVRIIQIPTKYTKEQFSVYEPGMNGISWGEDEGIKLNVDDFRWHYEKLKVAFEDRLEEFIEETQAY